MAKSLSAQIQWNEIDMLYFYSSAAAEINELGGLESLANLVIPNSSVTSVHFIWYEIGPERSKYIAEIIRYNTHILEMHLRSASIGLGVKWIGEAIKENSTLHMIELHGNNIGDEGAKWIAEGIEKNSALQKIDLSNNSIGDEGAKWIAQGIEKNSSLKAIDLSRNEINDTGAGYIGRALMTNQVIQVVDISSNKIGTPFSAFDRVKNFFFGRPDLGFYALIDSIKLSSSLLEVNLRDNRLDYSCSSLFEDILKHNINLKIINLTENKFRVSAFVKMHSLLAQNQKLRDSLNRLHLCAVLLKFASTPSKLLIRITMDKVILKFILYPLLLV
jgi:hypothetical protein